MSRIAYVNGRYVRHRNAMVHVEDRGYQFADGVYEVVVVHRGALIDGEAHLDRLDRSLRELRIVRPMSRAALQLVMRELLRRNRVRDGLLYLQVTRGVARRDHKFPLVIEPALVMTARCNGLWSEARFQKGVSVISLDDIRWGRADIKSVSLIANVLAKQAAAEAGAYEAWLLDRDGAVTEGASSNAWLVGEQGQLVTRGIGSEILGGVTRATILRLAADMGVRVEERAFTIDEVRMASEAFLSSSSSAVLPVLKIDGGTIGDGRPGPVTRRLYDAYIGYVRSLSETSETRNTGERAG